MQIVAVSSLVPSDSLPENTAFRCLVTLLWPFSSATGQCALLLADPDFRKRYHKGQVRVRFAGPSAKAIGASKIGIGDQVELSLQGARWVNEVDGPLVKTPGRGLEGELMFSARLKLVIRNQGQDERVVEVDESASTSRRDAAPSTPAPRQFRRSMLGMDDFGTAIYSSPAFMKRLRLSQGSRVESPYTPTSDDDNDGNADHDDNDSNTAASRKRRRVSYKNMSEWKFIRREPSPEQQVEEPPAVDCIAPIQTEPTVSSAAVLAGPKLESDAAGGVQDEDEDIVMRDSAHNVNHVQQQEAEGTTHCLAHNQVARPTDYPDSVLESHAGHAPIHREQTPISEDPSQGASRETAKVTGEQETEQTQQSSAAQDPTAEGASDDSQVSTTPQPSSAHDPNPPLLASSPISADKSSSTSQHESTETGNPINKTASEDAVLSPQTGRDLVESNAAQPDLGGGNEEQRGRQNDPTSEPEQPPTPQRTGIEVVELEDSGDDLGQSAIVRGVPDSTASPVNHQLDDIISVNESMTDDDVTSSSSSPETSTQAMADAGDDSHLLLMEPTHNQDHQNSDTYDQMGLVRSSPVLEGGAVEWTGPQVLAGHESATLLERTPQLEQIRSPTPGSDADMSSEDGYDDEAIAELQDASDSEEEEEEEGGPDLGIFSGALREDIDEQDLRDMKREEDGSERDTAEDEEELVHDDDQEGLDEALLQRSDDDTGNEDEDSHTVGYESAVLPALWDQQEYEPSDGLSDVAAPTSQVVQPFNLDGASPSKEVHAEPAHPHMRTPPTLPAETSVEAADEEDAWKARDDAILALGGVQPATPFHTALETALPARTNSPAPVSGDPPQSSQPRLAVIEISDADGNEDEPEDTKEPMEDGEGIDRTNEPTEASEEIDDTKEPNENDETMEDVEELEYNEDTEVHKADEAASQQDNYQEEINGDHEAVKVVTDAPENLSKSQSAIRSAASIIEAPGITTSLEAVDPDAVTPLFSHGKSEETQNLTTSEEPEQGPHYLYQDRSPPHSNADHPSSPRHVSLDNQDSRKETPGDARDQATTEHSTSGHAHEEDHVLDSSQKILEPVSPIIDHPAIHTGDSAEVGHETLDLPQPTRQDVVAPFFESASESAVQDVGDAQQLTSSSFVTLSSSSPAPRQVVPVAEVVEAIDLSQVEPDYWRPTPLSQRTGLTGTQRTEPVPDSEDDASTVHESSKEPSRQPTPSYKFTAGTLLESTVHGEVVGPSQELGMTQPRSFDHDKASIIARSASASQAGQKADLQDIDGYLLADYMDDTPHSAREQVSPNRKSTRTSFPPAPEEAGAADEMMSESVQGESQAIRAKAQASADSERINDAPLHASETQQHIHVYPDLAVQGEEAGYALEQHSDGVSVQATLHDVQTTSVESANVVATNESSGKQIVDAVSSDVGDELEAVSQPSHSIWRDTSTKRSEGSPESRRATCSPERKETIQTEDAVLATPLAKQSTPTTRKSLTARMSGVPSVISAWFTPRRSSGLFTRIKEDSPATEAKGVPATAPPKLRAPLPHDRAISPPRLGRLASQGTTTSLSYFHPLASVEGYLNQTSTSVDIVAISVVASGVPLRAKSGPKDFFTILHLLDPSLHQHNSAMGEMGEMGNISRQDMRVEVFRPWKATLPTTEAGDVVLLRNFSVKSQKHRPYLLSNEASSWCVWRFAASGANTQEHDAADIFKPTWARERRSSIKEEVKGPPVDIGPEEREKARELRKWWEGLQSIEAAAEQQTTKASGSQGDENTSVGNGENSGD